MTESKKSDEPRGRVFINTELCKGCGFCIEFCPAGVLGFSNTFNAKGYHPPRVIKDADCVNCRLCEMLCPEFAIFCTKIEPEAVSES